MPRTMPGGVPMHELIISGTLGFLMGVVGYYVTRALGPHVESLIGRAGA